MAKSRYRRRFADKIEDRDPSFMWMDFGGYILPAGRHYAAVADGLTVFRGPEILMQTRLLTFGETVGRGRTVVATTPSWLALSKEVLRNPSLMDFFPSCHRKFEEFVAGGYHRSQWSEVILSPGSCDGGFDIAARWHTQQILDEAKAYKPSRLVSRLTVRAALGLLHLHGDVSQVRVTTTSRFGRRVMREFGRLIPGTLQLRDRAIVLQWLSSMRLS
jgi:hypothetical protein